MTSNVFSILLPEIKELIAQGDRAALSAFCRGVHPADVAEAIADLSPDDLERFFALVDAEEGAEVFGHLPEELQVRLATRIGTRRLAAVLTHMPPDERVDLVKAIPEEAREAVLPALAHAEREDIRRLAAYQEGTAGSVMTSDYASLPPDITVREALERLRHEAPDRETIYYVYIVDSDHRLIGFVSLKDLILARPDQRLDELMHREIISVNATDDQETVAREIQKYDFIAIPVVDDRGVLVGIVTHDDALDILTQEQTEDLEKLMAIGGSHEPGVYLAKPAWEHFRNRAGWIVGLAALEIVSGWIIHSYEATLSHLMILALYMPMVADTGGNTGSQSATVVVRALALGEIKPSFKDILRVLWKELQVAVLLAVVLGVLSSGKVLFLSHHSYIPAGFSLGPIAGVIGLALAIQVVTATLVGAILPMGAAALDLDPAVVASPALTTIVDITGLLIYFTTAKMLLGI
ncbi:MAG TPA: magnesium transporter [Acidobacteria bacterium]|nr:magnesium transporter [Acidobacteriota bacterium]